jgi:hypothetical protein
MLKKSDYDFAMWLNTLTPEQVEPERFGSVDIYRNRFGTQLHKAQMEKHRILKIQRKLNLSNRTVEREPRQSKTPRLSPSYLAIVREEIKRIKNG